MEIGWSQPKMRPGRPAPDFELQGTDDEIYSLKDFADNEALLVVFTCNPDPHARAKIPVLNQLTAEYDDLAVVGINSNYSVYPEGQEEDTLENMKKYVSGDIWYIDTPIQYDAYLRDDTQQTARCYGAEITPDPFLFANEDGTFRLAYHGRIDDALDMGDEPTKRYMRDAVEAVLDDEPVDEEFLPSKGQLIRWGVRAPGESFDTP